MRRETGCRFEIALLVGLSMAGFTFAAEPDDDDDAPAAEAKSGGSWFSRWFGREEKKEDPAQKPDQAKKPKDDPAAKARAREKADYLRRLDICLRLTRIADETRDEELRRRVEELDRRIYAVYLKRIQRWTNGGAGSDLDEQILDKHLGAETKDRSAALRRNAGEKDRHTSAREGAKP